MASTRLGKTKDGKEYYEITVSNGRGQTRYTTRWYKPDGLSKKNIEKLLNKAVVDFENDCRNGLVYTREQTKQIKKERELEFAKMPTFKEYAEKVYMPFKRTTCVESTCDWYEDMLDHLYEFFGDLKLTDISISMCQEYFLKLAEENVAWSTKRARYLALHGLLQVAYESEVISRNPCLPKFKPQQTKDEKIDDEIKYCSVEEVVRMRKELSNEPLMWETMINVLLDTGIRRGEVAAITWNKINFVSGSILIDRNAVKSSHSKKGQPKVRVANTKSGRNRTVFVSKDTLGLLKRWKEEQRKSSNIVPQYVFTERDDYTSPIYPDSITSRCKKFGEKYNFENFHTHMTRHSFASNVILNGGDILTVSKTLGHSDPSITLNIYSHASTEAIKSTAEMLHNLTHTKEA